jgi:hypothetical protein
VLKVGLRLLRQLLFAVVAAIVTVVVCLHWRGFPMVLAVFSGIGVGVLVAVTLRTIERMRLLLR